MIIDQLKNVSQYCSMNSELAEAFQYLLKLDTSNLPAGRYPLGRNGMYMLVQEYNTRLAEDCAWEAHWCYIDIQYMLNGQEIIGYANLSTMEATDYDDSKDTLHLRGTGDHFVLRPGYFVVLMPQDAHKPGMAVDAPQSVKKIVIKVPAS